MGLSFLRHLGEPSRYLVCVVAQHADTPTLVPGRSLDRYQLVCPVATGGMASVWLALLRGKHGFEKTVALKTILPSFARQAHFRRMFLDEAKIASGIEHVNVAQILDLGEQDGQLYLVMEWVEGDSLQELDRAAERAGASLPIPVLVRVMADVCAGLHAAHELCDAQGKPLNVVHRDISPQNILISRKGVVKVIDFGVVKARRRVTEETSTGTIKGKLQYMAPEQALGKAVDRRADVWSVGATLYRLLARRPVYRGRTPHSTFQRLTSAVTPEPLPTDVPPALASIVHRALSFEAERRFSSAAELGAALEALLQGPYQTTSREVAACMDAYLGKALASRRADFVSALEHTRTPRRGEGQRALPKPLSEPASLVPIVRVLAEEVTRPLPGALRRRASSRRSQWAAVAGVVALATVVVWACASAERQRVAVGPKATSRRAATREEAAPVPVAQEPAQLSVDALPLLKESLLSPASSSSSAESVDAGARKRHAAGPAVKPLTPAVPASGVRAVVAAKLEPSLKTIAVSKPKLQAKPTASLKPAAPATAPKHQVVDDGF